MTPSSKDPIDGPRLDHTVFWVLDSERTARFLTEIVGWKRHPIRIAVSEDDTTTGGMVGTFIDGNGLWVELIEPTSPGPGMDILNRVGDGAMVEINFELGDNYSAILDGLQARGIEMLSMDGTPLKDGGRIREGVVKGNTIDTLEQTGQRIAYFPASVSCGPGIEYYERITDDPDGLMNVRDRMWRDVEREQNTPRVDHVTIVCKNIEQTAAFYTDVVGLTRQSRTFDASNIELYGGEVDLVYIDANGVFSTDLFIKLVQPLTPGPLTRLLDQHGDGYLMEIGVELPDLPAFRNRMADRNVRLVGFEEQKLSAGEDGLVLSPEGHRCAYFSLADSFGMRVMLFDRGRDDVRAGKQITD